MPAMVLEDTCGLRLATVDIVLLIAPALSKSVHAPQLFVLDVIIALISALSQWSMKSAFNQGYDSKLPAMKEQPWPSKSSIFLPHTAGYGFNQTNIIPFHDTRPAPGKKGKLTCNGRKPQKNIVSWSCGGDPSAWKNSPGKVQSKQQRRQSGHKVHTTNRVNNELTNYFQLTDNSFTQLDRRHFTW